MQFKLSTFHKQLDDCIYIVTEYGFQKDVQFETRKKDVTLQSR